MPQEILYSFNSDRKSQENYVEMMPCECKRNPQGWRIAATISSFQIMGNKRCALSSVSIAKALRNQTKSKE